MNSDRLVGAATLVVAIAVAFEARTFRVSFYTDPLGARGLPFIAASLLGIGALLLTLEPRANIASPSAAVLRRGAAVAICLVLYSVALPFFGFLLSTITALSVLSVIFGGPPIRSIALAAVYTGTLYVLFAFVLGLPLPIGNLFVRGS